MKSPDLNAETLLTLMQAILADHPFGLLLLDHELRPLWYNKEAALACSVWVHGERKGRALRLNQESFTLPPVLVEACRSMLTGWPGRRPPPSLQSVIDQAHGLHVRIRVMICGKAPAPAFYIQFDYRRPRTDRDRPLSPEALALYSRLSEREREVALLVRDGLSNREIAAALNRSPLTIKTQVAGLMPKLGVRSRSRVAVLLNR